MSNRKKANHKGGWKRAKKEGRRFQGAQTGWGGLRQLGGQRAVKVGKGEKGETERRGV